MSASTITAKVKLDLAKAIKLDPTLTPAARLVGLFIADHLNTGRGFAWPSQDVIARELGIALRTVQRSMGVLRRHFEIMQRPGVVNEYRPAPRSIRRGYPRRNVGQPLSKCRVTPVKMSGYNDPSYYPLNDPLKQTSAGRASREMFSAFKEVYPKRSDQGWSAAEKHFNAAVRSGVDPNDVVQAGPQLRRTDAPGAAQAAAYPDREKLVARSAMARRSADARRHRSPSETRNRRTEEGLRVDQ